MAGVPAARGGVGRRPIHADHSAELWLTASLAPILNVTTPLFALLLAATRLREPLTGRRPAGVLLGIGGVGVLVSCPPA